MGEYVGNPNTKLINLMDTTNPMMSGVVQNQDSYMKGKIAQRWYYDRVGPALEEAFQLFADKTKTGINQIRNFDRLDFIVSVFVVLAVVKQAAAKYVRCGYAFFDKAELPSCVGHRQSV